MISIPVFRINPRTVNEDLIPLSRFDTTNPLNNCLRGWVLELTCSTTTAEPRCIEANNADLPSESYLTRWSKSIVLSWEWRGDFQFGCHCRDKSFGCVREWSMGGPVGGEGVKNGKAGIFALLTFVVAN